MIVNPVISISNKLRFKYKFILLASMFYVPLLGCILWIVNDQNKNIEQYEQQQIGFDIVRKIVMAERDIADYRQDSAEGGKIESSLSAITTAINSQSVLFEPAIMQARELHSSWGEGSKNFSATDLGRYDDYYSQSLALRENISALSGLVRENDAIAFYLSELSVNRLPAFAEYLARYKTVTDVIIRDGFNAESYTFIVAIDKRLDELQLQLGKTNEHLKRIAPEHGSFVNRIAETLNSVEQYQQAIRRQVIDPDQIQMTLSQAKQQARSAVESLHSLTSGIHKELSARLATLKSDNQNALLILIVVLVLVTVITSYFLWGMYRSLSSNVKAIQLAAQAMGDGDFSDTVACDANDEIGDIAKSFIQMQTKINNLLVTFEQDTLALRQAANDIHVLTDDMQQNIAAQQRDTHSVVEHITQVNDSVITIADNTDGAKGLTEQANNHVAQGQVIIGETGEAISDISTEVNASAAVINALAQDSSEIAQFVNVIREIAEQTNLLALNAAIEAARAGEQGRGFAVVADEVRTLASRTQDSTAEIQRIIEKLQAGANKSVEAMNQGVIKAEHGVTKTTEVQSAFNEITQTVENIVAATTEISAAVKQQKQMVEGINSRTSSIAQGADEVMLASDKAAGAGQNLSTLADHLTQQLSQFVLKH